ncbi:MAG TPA: glycerophosphodiester phosphodiesterase [Candidatus Babeliales bacterium]|jgi:glycerophosphoryl diester phosphodiesterase|nr:glycerophosphodiester phosphodiesterase [Candidatus Babeliales bacterium]
MKKIFVGIILWGFTLSQAYIVIGHRGAAGYAPENTLSSFALAIKCGVDMVEFDVWKCASGELVVFHDAKVEQLTDGYGAITAHTLQELRKLTVLGYEKIPTLIEVLDFIDRRVKIYIEIKDAAIAHDVVKIIEHYVGCKHWYYEDFLVASFDHTQLYDIKTANSLIPVAVLLYGIPLDLGSCASTINADVVSLSIDFINQQFVDDIHDRGISVYVYTINDPDDLIRVTNYRVDGIITDYPCL